MAHIATMRDKLIEEQVSASRTQVGGDHYVKMHIQPIDYIVENKIDYMEGNIIKYVSRHESKGGAEDIRKVIHYAQMILEKKYGETK